MIFLSILYNSQYKWKTAINVRTFLEKPKSEINEFPRSLIKIIHLSLAILFITIRIEFKCSISIENFIVLIHRKVCCSVR